MARSVLAAVDHNRRTRETWHSLKSANFAAALSAPVLGKSPHFALHHYPASPSATIAAAKRPLVHELSTDTAPNRSTDVDNAQTSAQWWLGLVVPKRHARRAVTRSLLKRQMRAHADGQRHRLPPGQWVIRLRAPFDARQYPSASSAQLREAARLELDLMFASVLTS